jgi:hypothetical protein
VWFQEVGNWEVDKVQLMGLSSMVEIGISAIQLELASSVKIGTCFYSFRGL